MKIQNTGFMNKKRDLYCICVKPGLLQRFICCGSPGFIYAIYSVIATAFDMSLEDKEVKL